MCQLNACGDGDQGPDEQCDDGNLVDGDGCSAVCGLEGCGNKIVDPGEACDDGADGDNDDGCTDACQVPACGDGFVQASLMEQCDDGGNNSDSGACTLACKKAICGDGLIEANVEQCDDGPNNGPGKACKADCSKNVCGDGDKGPGEACDDGNNNNNDACTNVCKLATCGDGFAQPGEECDLGMNNNNTGMCTLACKNPKCGDLFIQPSNSEQCDDGNQSNTDACLNTCKTAICGDAFVQQGVEQCDDGNQVNTDACLNTCKTATCGDAVVQAGVEQCDDGNQVNTDACAQCKTAKCGDGFIQAGVEECDDGNIVSNDGCSATCKAEGCVLTPAMMNLPATVHQGNFYGEIAFDAQCNVLVGTAFSGGLSRVSKTNGAVTSIVAKFGAAGSSNGVAFRPQDNLIYVATDIPAQLWTTDGVNAPVLVVNYPQTVNAIAVAPAAFGPYAGQIIGVTTAGTVNAVNPANKTITTIGTSSGILSDLVFSPAGTTLYVANNTNNRIDAMTSGGVFTTLIAGLSAPDGLGMDLDGSRLFVAHFPNGGRIDRVSLPGAVLTAGTAVNLDGGYYTTGVVVDFTDNVFYKTQTATNAQVNFFKAP
jgi:cysteine-rich repeat protein